MLLSSGFFFLSLINLFNIFCLFGSLIHVSTCFLFSKTKLTAESNFFTCQTCNAIFMCLNFFQQHRKEHAQSEGVTLFTCAHCPFVSDNNFNLNWHNMKHTKGQEHKCEICAPSEVSTNTWSNPFDIDSDAISSIDCSRFGKR